jgi:RNA polymerase sigma-70 factor (ECF subfamily)
MLTEQEPTVIYSTAVDAFTERSPMRVLNVSSDRQAKEGALTALFDDCYDRIVRYGFTRLGDRAEAEDLAGEVFLKALESLDSYRERGVPMEAWLFRIAHNQVVDRFRRAMKRKTVPIETVEVVAESDPEEQAVSDFEAARVRRALEGLTESQRRVIELRFFGELTSEETGYVLNKRAGAVRELQSAAIKALRRLLEEEPPLKEGVR